MPAFSWNNPIIKWVFVHTRSYNLGQGVVDIIYTDVLIFKWVFVNICFYNCGLGLGLKDTSPLQKMFVWNTSTIKLLFIPPPLIWITSNLYHRNVFFLKSAPQRQILRAPAVLSSPSVCLLSFNLRQSSQWPLLHFAHNWIENWTKILPPLPSQPLPGCKKKTNRNWAKIWPTDRHSWNCKIKTKAGNCEERGTTTSKALVNHFVGWTLNSQWTKRKWGHWPDGRNLSKSKKVKLTSRITSWGPKNFVYNLQIH